jgi:membrane-bound lytic murein transglycosylase MltF
LQLVRQFRVLAVVLLVAASGCASEIAVLRNGFTIRHEKRQVMGAHTRLYTSADRKNYVDVPTDQIEYFEEDDASAVPVPATPGPVAQPLAAKTPVQPTAIPSLDELVKQASEKHKLDADFINSVIHAESGFNPRAVSPKGARGLMQLMPDTASKLGVANSFDPRANVDGGTRYLRGLLERYNFDVPKALAAYNAGPHRVEKYKGIPPYYETQAYVARIIKEYNRKKIAEQKAARKAKAVISKSSARPAQPGRSKPSDPRESVASP